MEEIRAAVEINGKCNTKTRSEWSYSRWLKLQRGKVLSIFTDLGMKQILLAQCYNLQNICLRHFKIHIQISFPATGLFLPGPAENSWQE
jgi:hypothetical protein